MTSPSGRRGAAAVPMRSFAKASSRRPCVTDRPAPADLAMAAPVADDAQAVFAAFARTLERLVAPPRAGRRGRAR
jgi:hypothetical protein